MSGSEENTGPGGPGELQEPGRQPDSSPEATVDSPSGPLEGQAPASPSPQAPDAPPPAGEPPPAPPKVDWRDRRIGELTARTREMRLELERLRAAQNAPNGQAPTPATGYNGAPPGQDEINRQVEQLASIKASQAEFNRRCNDAAEVGRRQYPDFDARVGQLVGLVDPNDPVGVESYNQFLNAALETGEASRIIHSLGGDLNEASRILSLTPLRMAVELTRLAARPVREMSTAPKPINPASTSAQNNRVSVSPDDPSSDNLPTAEWMRRREEQLASRPRR